MDLDRAERDSNPLNTRLCRPPHPIDPARLHVIIDLIEEEAGRLGLSLKASKCRSPHLSGGTPVGLRDSQLHVNGSSISVIRDFEGIAYLGRPVGFNILQGGTDMDAAIHLGTQDPRLHAGIMATPQHHFDFYIHHYTT
ncbi:hypothetical protein IscW_ISCW013841 [Ixodes scapularis]|uniref:Uncharacterized protein n=1 Tax=Ixodes scapularis TaxID=6945 RepID=B7QHU5_IXOSC|nr:hypothetical protein IscW_ISCW013841 [Ixodes scapularis]|eukprot:XP_002414752.1 hypothetical protein IscW_ISCW013841 [Ixodes scapularis]